MAGRKPIPTKLHILRGNPGKRPLNKREPKPKEEMPQCPAHLNETAKREWERIAPKLFDIGLLTEIDGSALAGLCQSYATWAEASEHLNKTGLLIKGKNGLPLESPYLRIARRALSDLRPFLVEFGMTSSSRSKIKVDPNKNKKNNPWDNI